MPLSDPYVQMDAPETLAPIRVAANPVQIVKTVYAMWKDFSQAQYRLKVGELYEEAAMLLKPFAPAFANLPSRVLFDTVQLSNA